MDRVVLVGLFSSSQGRCVRKRAARPALLVGAGTGAQIMALLVEAGTGAQILCRLAMAAG
jgi:hypothetical protein